MNIYTNEDTPPTHSRFGMYSSPVKGSVGERILKTARVLAMTSHALASAKKRPGQILGDC